MFLRHIQLIFSPLVKTWKIEKCFTARKNFLDKFACWFHRFCGWKHPVNKAVTRICREAGNRERAPPHQGTCLSACALLAKLSTMKVAARLVLVVSLGSSRFPFTHFTAVMKRVLLSSLVLVRRALP